MPRVSYARCTGSSARDKAELTPTTHAKGGEAWDVQIDGVHVGQLRRWERNEMSITVGPSRGWIEKRCVTKWTAYPATDGGKGWVYDSRAAALRFLRDSAKEPTNAP